jgi:hypothetical protein
MLIDIILVLTGLFILALILAPIYYFVKQDQYNEEINKDKDA